MSIRLTVHLHGRLENVGCIKYSKATISVPGARNTDGVYWCLLTKYTKQHGLCSNPTL